jgi:hypothetical protein
MSLFFEIAGGGAAGNSIGNDRVRLTMPPLTIRAEAGDVGMSGIVFDDPDDFIGTTHTPLGIRGFAVSETAASPDKIFQGYFADRTIRRGESPRGSLRIGAQREWDASLLDLNNAVYRRVIRNSDGNRPAETDLARISWLLGSAYTSNLADYGLVAATGAIDLDAADYRGRYPADVLTDCGAASGRNWFVYIDDSAQNGPWALAYFDATGSSFTTSIKVSNTASDRDGVTVFEPNEAAELVKDPSQLYSGVFLQYAGGSVYRENTTTFTGLDKRDIAIDDPNIKSRAAAIARADRYLDQYATEAETLKYTITVPAATVNSVRAGQRMQVKFSHLPGYTSYTYVRIVTLTVSQHEGSDAYYDLAIEAKSPKLVAGTRVGATPAGTVNNNVPPPSPTTSQTGLRFTISPHLTAFAFGDPNKHANFVLAYTNSISGTPVWIMSGDSPYTAQASFSADSTAGDTTGLVIHSSNKVVIGDGTSGIDVPMNTPLYLVVRYTDGGTGTAYTNGGTTVAFSAPTGTWTGPPAGLSIVTTAGAVSSGGSGSVFTLCSFIVTDGTSASAPAFGQPATPEQIAGDGSTTTFTTNYPFVEGTLQVFVGDVLVTPSSVTGTTGSFTLPVTVPTGTNIVVFYYGTGATATGATNTTTLTAGPTHVPTSMLGSGTASATTFLRGDQTWAVPSGASFGSNSNSVGSANAPGASSSNARADHVHQGIHQLTSNGSNALFENVNVAAGSGIALGVAGQTVTITNTGSRVAALAARAP